MKEKKRNVVSREEQEEGKNALGKKEKECEEKKWNDFQGIFLFLSFCCCLFVWKEKTASSLFIVFDSCSMFFFSLRYLLNCLISYLFLYLYLDPPSLLHLQTLHFSSLLTKGKKERYIHCLYISCHFVRKRRRKREAEKMKKNKV